MKKRIYLSGFVCILLCVLFSVPAYADESPQNLETESVPEIASTSTITISPADNFIKIGERQRYTCIGATGIPTWTIRDTNIATVNATGLVTGISQGITYLTAYVDGVYITATIRVGALEEGTYYIGNRMSGLYMELENATPTEGTPVQQWKCYGQPKSQWIITLESAGYYSIRSALTNYYIGVENSSTAEGAAIKQYASIANQSGRQWKISATSDGTYRFIPYSYTIMALAVPETGATVKGTDLVQLNCFNITDYRDEWMVAVENAVTTFLAIPDTGHDHEGSFSDVTFSVNIMGYGENYIYSSANYNSCKQMIASSDIFYSRSHGNQTTIQLSEGTFSVSELNSENNYVFSECSLVLFGACKTGLGRDYRVNLVNQTQSRGVTTVIGFETSVNCHEMNEWAKAFFAALAQKETVEDACRAADDAVLDYYEENDITYETSTVGHWYIAGSKTQILHMIP